MIDIHVYLDVFYPIGMVLASLVYAWIGILHVV